MELLSPAGNTLKMKAAILYGADAVYLAGDMFGMRAAADNFSADEMTAAVGYAHNRGAKVYVTVNTMPHTDEYPALRRYLDFLGGEARPDALIVTDPGVFMTAMEVCPTLPLHVSTQASVVSAAACLAWAKLGASRVILARELSLAEIAAIKREVGGEIELETFVHGSMCVAYSGRCLMSNYFTGRDGNRGMCAQPCRWNYSVTGLQVTEEKRPGDPFIIEQDGGAFVMSSRDMCMVEHIEKLHEAGVDSIKIEERIKSAYYAAVVTNSYRIAMDAAASGKPMPPELLRELESVSHREYSTGFFFGSPAADANTVAAPGYIREKAYLAAAVYENDGKSDLRDGDGYALFIQRNKFSAGDTVEQLSPGSIGAPFTAGDMLVTDEDGAVRTVNSVPHPNMLFRMKSPYPVYPGTLLRSGD